jgi:crotonobetainyl-CoA:carnitine CoA-transferase CaiB-like acyl-CoA transferase
MAGFGADVLRIDPPTWDEPGVVPEVTLGKRCARLDLRSSADRAIWLELLRRADVLVHGYRADALDNLGLDARTRRDIRPGLVDVSLNAYGWSGPLRNRRGFDSLVQMSAGIADAGMRLLAKDRPTPLPFQALDHATGYLLAAAVVRGLTQRIATGRGFEARASLDRSCLTRFSVQLLLRPHFGGFVHFWGRSTVGWSSRNFSRMAAVCKFGDRRPSSQLRSDGKVA